MKSGLSCTALETCLQHSPSAWLADSGSWRRMLHQKQRLPFIWMEDNSSANTRLSCTNTRKITMQTRNLDVITATDAFQDAVSIFSLHHAFHSVATAVCKCVQTSRHLPCKLWATCSNWVIIKAKRFFAQHKIPLLWLVSPSNNTKPQLAIRQPDVEYIFFPSNRWLPGYHSLL